MSLLFTTEFSADDNDDGGDVSDVSVVEVDDEDAADVVVVVDVDDELVVGRAEVVLDEVALAGRLLAVTVGLVFFT